jgi:hypothetical protein
LTGIYGELVFELLPATAIKAVLQKIDAPILSTRNGYLLAAFFQVGKRPKAGLHDSPVSGGPVHRRSVAANQWRQALAMGDV